MERDRPPPTPIQRGATIVAHFPRRVLELRADRQQPAERTHSRSNTKSEAMPKNKGKGGKNRRRGKNENEETKRTLEFKEPGQGALDSGSVGAKYVGTHAGSLSTPRRRRTL